MSTATAAVNTEAECATLDLPSYIAGAPASASSTQPVFNPYTGELVGHAGRVGRDACEQAIERALTSRPALTRYRRFEILDRARQLLETRAETFAQLIRREAGLCIRDTRYEVARALDCLRFAAMETLRDDGQIFAGDVSPHGKPRKIFTLREPLNLALAITPFNHPLNQVVHKLAPAIAAGTPMILKPSEKTPLTAIRFAELLYEAGLPGPMLSVLLGSVEEVIEPLVRDPRIELITFTGSVAIGKRIAAIAGYKRLCLELGGNSPLIVLDDADLELAVKLAAEGSYRNSGQRCTAVKRLLIHQPILAEFTERFIAKTAEYRCGDPADPETVVGTVIDEPAAKHLESLVAEAVQGGACVRAGGKRVGALVEPTVISGVRRTDRMVVHEAFGPLAPILPVRDLDDAIGLANGTAFGLATGIVTTNLGAAIEAAKRIRTGTVNVNEIPGYRIESQPFGGVKDSGLGIKEGIVEAIKFMSAVKTCSIPW